MHSREIKWYKIPTQELDYTKPIVSERTGGVELLLPQIKGVERVSDRDGYEVVGFNWFNLVTGQWGSCCTWDTPQAAVADRTRNHQVYNAIISVVRE